MKIKKLLFVVAFVFFGLNVSNVVFATEVTPTPTVTVTPEPTPEQQEEQQEEVVIIALTQEEKQIFLDSIQLIRAILVFFLLCLVFYVVISFLSWFF